MTPHLLTLTTKKLKPVEKQVGETNKTVVSGVGEPIYSQWI